MRVLWFRCDEIIPGTAIGVGFIAILLALFFASEEYLSSEFASDNLCGMASEAESRVENYRNEGHSAFILGYTGESGKSLVNQLNKQKLFKRVVLIGRREVPLDPSLGPEFEQKIVDYDKLEDYKDVFNGLDVGFSCLGTTRAKAGAEGFVKVDHDYVLNSASVAKEMGCKHLSVISSMAANKNSSFLYTRIKGQVEEGLKVMHFDQLSIFRPSVILCDREERRSAEKAAMFLLKPVAYLFPTAMTIPVEVLTQGIINNVIAPSSEKVSLFENKAIHHLSGTYSGCKAKSSSVDAESDKAK